MKLWKIYKWNSIYYWKSNDQIQKTHHHYQTAFEKCSSVVWLKCVCVCESGWAHARIDLTRTLYGATYKWLVINFIFGPLTIGQPSWNAHNKSNRLHIATTPTQWPERIVWCCNSKQHTQCSCVIHWNWLMRREHMCAQHTIPTGICF